MESLVGRVAAALLLLQHRCGVAAAPVRSDSPTDVPRLGPPSFRLLSPSAAILSASSTLASCLSAFFALLITRLSTFFFSRLVSC